MGGPAAPASHCSRDFHSTKFFMRTVRDVEVGDADPRDGEMLRASKKLDWHVAWLGLPGWEPKVYQVPR